jgi:hypothetical protein
MLNGWVISFFVLLPNLLVIILPPKNIPLDMAAKKSMGWKVIEILERTGQAACFIIPVFNTLRFDTATNKIILLTALLTLLFYYSGWLRYALSGQGFLTLFSPLGGIPIPMAIAPILIFLLTGINMHSWPMVIASFILAAGHLPISWHEWKRCQAARS